jgi:hypothetical protein
MGLLLSSASPRARGNLPAVRSFVVATPTSPNGFLKPRIGACRDAGERFFCLEMPLSEGERIKRASALSLSTETPNPGLTSGESN